MIYNVFVNILCTKFTLTIINNITYLLNNKFRKFRFTRQYLRDQAFKQYIFYYLMLGIRNGFAFIIYTWSHGGYLRNITIMELKIE